MERDPRTIRVLIPARITIRTVRRVDFNPRTEDTLPSMTIDGLSRQAKIEVEEQKPEGCADDQFSQCQLDVNSAQNPSRHF